MGAKKVVFEGFWEKGEINYELRITNYGIINLEFRF